MKYIASALKTLKNMPHGRFWAIIIIIASTQFIETVEVVKTFNC